ncbi:MAG: aminotransferase class I/II-fold pyridoxal phosphate-dependent enzyme [Phycisphaerae bacterium]|jgi:aspartate/methionine/tyrosine aminotransferase
MKMPVFEMERYQSTWENVVEYNLSESGVEPVTLRDLEALGLDLTALANTPLGYSQTNGTVELREALAEHYPGATVDHIEVTNGTSEANYLLCLTLLNEGDEVLFESPNYMQFAGIPPSVGATVCTFSLRVDRNWEPDWDAFEAGLTPKTKLIYVSHPNNPTGSVLSHESMERLVEAAERVGAYVVADEVYQGAEFDGNLTPTFWGMSDRVIVTSGLSKAFGIPGVRIGWVVGPEEIVAACWGQHDYTTIGPSVIGDAVARVAVEKENRRKLFARGAELLSRNLAVVRRWVEGFGGFLEYVEPQAGAFAFVKYHAPTPSAELAEQIRRTQSVLVVPGAQLGEEGHLRISIGVPRETLEWGLARVKTVLDSLTRS